MSEDITFITGNPHKAAYLSKHLGISLDHQTLDLPEIQSLDLKEIVLEKARIAFHKIQAPVLVEDASLIFTAIQPLPGPLVKWFLSSLGAVGLAELANKYEDRSALSQVLFCLYDASGSYFFSGEVAGTIASTPRGSLDFGWDAIFIPEGQDLTRGEMSDEQKDAVSMRKPALDKLRAFLQTYKNPA